MRNAKVMMSSVLLGGALAVLALAPASARAQSLADFDYENLAFRGIGFESGYILPNKVDPTTTFGARLDLGYLGPGIRIVPGLTYWSSFLTRAEVSRLEDRLGALIQGGAPVEFNLGEIRWSDLVMSLDGHLVLSFPAQVLSFTGIGFSAHIMNGSGAAIDGTFVEDLLDSVTAGVNVHTGLEYAFSRARIYGMGRYEVLSNLRYAEFRLGAAIMFGPSMPGEIRGGRNGG